MPLEPVDVECHSDFSHETDIAQCMITPSSVFPSFWYEIDSCHRRKSVHKEWSFEMPLSVMDENQIYTAGLAFDKIQPMLSLLVFFLPAAKW